MTRGGGPVLFHPHYYSVGDRAAICARILARMKRAREIENTGTYLWMDSLLTFGRIGGGRLRRRLAGPLPPVTGVSLNFTRTQ